MLLVDLDALVIRNPHSIRSGDRTPSRSEFFAATLGADFALHPEFDIISSTDHGHASRDFPWGSQWKLPFYPYDIRLCTGFIFLRYSADMAALVRMVWEYQQGDTRVIRRIALSIYFNGELSMFSHVLCDFALLIILLPIFILFCFT